MKIESGENGFGAVVTGARLGALARADWRAIEDAFHRFAVLVFPAANITEEEHLAFSRRFGALERTLSKRAKRVEISLLSNVEKNGVVAKPEAALGRFLQGNRHWHTDSSFKKVGAKASLLRALEVPTSGGDTEWADMRAAWDALAAETQARLEGMVFERIEEAKSPSDSPAQALSLPELFPPHDFGTWPAGFAASREQIYGGDGR